SSDGGGVLTQKTRQVVRLARAAMGFLQERPRRWLVPSVERLFDGLLGATVLVRDPGVAVAGPTVFNHQFALFGRDFAHSVTRSPSTRLGLHRTFYRWQQYRR